MATKVSSIHEFSEGINLSKKKDIYDDIYMAKWKKNWGTRKIRKEGEGGGKTDPWPESSDASLIPEMFARTL